MTGRWIAGLALAVAAAPAWAHEGGHLHPHGAGTWLALLPAAVLIVLAALVARRGR